MWQHYCNILKYELLQIAVTAEDNNIIREIKTTEWIKAPRKKTQK